MNVINQYRDYLVSQDNSDLGISLAAVKADCLAYIIDIANSNTKDTLQANKYLLEFNPKGKKEVKIPTILTDERTEQDYILLESMNNALQEVKE